MRVLHSIDQVLLACRRVHILDQGQVSQVVYRGGAVLNMLAIGPIEPGDGVVRAGAVAEGVCFLPTEERVWNDQGWVFFYNSHQW